MEIVQIGEKLLMGKIYPKFLNLETLILSTLLLYK